MMLLKSIGRFSIASLINFVVGILAVFLLTRYFEPRIYGIWSIFIMAANFLMFFAGFGFNDAFIRFSVEKPYIDEKNKFITACLKKSICVFSVIAIIIILCGEHISFYLFQQENRYLSILLVGYTFALLILNRFMINYFRVINDVRIYTILQVGGNTVAKLFVLLSLLDIADTTTILSYQTLGIVIFVTIAFLIYRKKVFASVFKTMNLDKKVYRFAFFSWINSSLFQLGSFAMPLVITSNLGPAAFGIYASTNIFNSVIAVANSAFTTYWSVFMFKHYADESIKIRQVHDYMMIGCITLITIVLMLQSIVYFLLGDSYQQSRLFFSFIVAGAIINFLNETTQYGISISKNLYEYTYIWIVYFIVNVMLSLFLMPIYGIAGAAMATLGASLIKFILSTWRGQHYYCSVNHIDKTMIGIMVIVSMSFINYSLFKMNQSYILIFVLYLCSLYIYKEQLVLVYRKIRG